MWDLIVIGAGPGGYVGAIRASQLGLKVLVIEKDKLGGTCLNRGCIPAKSLITDSKLYKQVKESQILQGTEQVSLDTEAMFKRKQRVVNALVIGVNSLLKANNIEIIKGKGELKDSQTVIIHTDQGCREEQAKNILLATGSKVQVLPFITVDGKFIQTTDEALDDANIPEHIAIIGGGVIGMEMAGMYANLGRQVTVFEVLPDVLITEDQDVRNLTKQLLKKQKVNLHLETRVNNLEIIENKVCINYKSQDGTEHSLTVDKLLTATGRSPVLEGINSDKLGLKMNGPFIQVNEHLQTSLPNVYAIGDVIGGAMLAHKASAEAEAAVEHMSGHTAHANRPIPACIWGPIEVGSAGLSEDKARAQGLNIKIGKFPYMGSGSAKAKGKTDGFVKIIGDADSGKLLGIHIAGENATDMIAWGASFINKQADVEEFYHSIIPHPTLGEIVMEAALDFSDRAIHMPPKKN